MLVESHDTQAAPIFVVGMNGSGTTMLADCLGQHSQIYAFIHETRVIPHIIQHAKKYGNLHDDPSLLALWEDLVKIPGIGIQLAGKTELPEGWRDWPRTVAGVIDGLFRYLAAQAGEKKVRWCEKTPMHALHMIQLSETFPNARFIHIIRDGRDCAASFHRRWKRTPELTIYRWREVLKKARIQSKNISGRYLEIRFEELTEFPERTLQKICQWLNIPYEPTMLVTRRRQKTNPGRDKIEKNSGLWCSHFSKKKLDKLEWISGGSLVDNGYQIEMFDEDHNPPRWRLNLWVMLDYGRQFAREFREQLSGDTYRPSWSVFFRHVLDALRQFKTNRFP